MAEHTKIEWSEATWNPITGCSVVSPGCTNCYAMRMAGTRLRFHPTRRRLTRDTKAGPVWTGEVRLNASWLDQPLRWKRPRRIFVAAHGDLFHESVPDEWNDRVFAVMALAPQHTFQVLTKRPERMRRYLADRTSGDPWAEAADYIADLRGMTDHAVVLEPQHMPLPNVWLGVSVEDQARADERIPILLNTPAAVRWISAEPLLGPVDLENLPDGSVPTGQKLDWVVIGGESGQGARVMNLAWARSLLDQCRVAGVPAFVKQLGRRELLTDPKGGDMTEWPEDLRVREWPRG